MTRTAMDMQHTICSKYPLNALVFLLIGSTVRKTKGHLYLIILVIDVLIFLGHTGWLLIVWIIISVIIVSTQRQQKLFSTSACITSNKTDKKARTTCNAHP